MAITFIALDHNAVTPARTVAIADRDAKGEPTRYLIRVSPPPFMGGSGGEVTLTADQFNRFQGWTTGSDNRMIQQILPDLSAADREMLMSGLTDADLRRLATDDALDAIDIFRGLIETHGAGPVLMTLRRALQDYAAGLAEHQQRAHEAVRLAGIAADLVPLINRCDGL